MKLKCAIIGCDRKPEYKISVGNNTNVLIPICGSHKVNFELEFQPK